MTADPVTERLAAYRSGAIDRRPAALSWHRSDPLTVALWFPRHRDWPAQMWMLDRDMCLLAMSAQAGFPGAVVLEPVTVGTLRFLRLTLWQSGVWELHLPPVAGFLGRTEAQYPKDGYAVAATHPMPAYDWDGFTGACWKARRPT